MHGFIFSQLKKFVVDEFGSATWLEILKKSGVGIKNYWPAYIYPDEEMYNLINAASNAANTEKASLLNNFGTFLAPGLMHMYKDLINSDWNTLDLIENTETRMHSAVRAKDLEAKPPQLDIKRLSQCKVRINYYSKRQFCELLKGIAKGIAKQNNEEIEVHESHCMYNGHKHCTILIESIAGD